MSLKETINEIATGSGIVADSDDRLEGESSSKRLAVVHRGNADAFGSILSKVKERRQGNLNKLLLHNPEIFVKSDEKIVELMVSQFVNNSSFMKDINKEIIGLRKQIETKKIDISQANKLTRDIALKISGKLNQLKDERTPEWPDDKGKKENSLDYVVNRNIHKYFTPRELRLVNIRLYNSISAHISRNKKNVQAEILAWWRPAVDFKLEQILEEIGEDDPKVIKNRKDLSQEEKVRFYNIARHRQKKKLVNKEELICP